ncbi:MAG: hypothetical protein K9H61_07905 [Bacteroidia bacterium]|nr:hypothetical protein [Bacteroidia bacterium]MCF8446906.1 hypothetical protein [Bacteroidia bacterium]
MKTILFFLLLILTYQNSFAQKKHGHKSGKYSEGGSIENTYHPLTTFDKKQDISIYVKMIKDNIHLLDDTLKYKRIYKDIYSNAKTGSNSSNHGNLASEAKDAAFVYLIGLDDEGDSLQNREWFKNRYLEIIDGWADKHNYHGKENQMPRALENIQLMQGYDYLRTAEWTGGVRLSDSQIESCREEIFNFTYDLFRKANNLNGAFGAIIRPDNNMALVVAGAIGMAAIVIHDRGTGWLAEQCKPKRWASTANAYINRVMWYDNKSMGTKILIPRGNQKNINRTSGYAEGPHYYRKAFESLWPYFQSFKNFTGGEQRGFGPYFKCNFCFTAEYLVNNFYADMNYLALNDWYVNLLLPNGYSPTFDDTWIDKSFAGSALDGIPSHSVIENPTADLIQNMNIKADYLAKFNYGKAPENESNYFNKNSGDLIVRFKSGNSPSERHYFHLNAENGSAINGNNYYLAEWFKFGHEHGDVTSISLFSGTDNLGIDPALYGTENNANEKINKGKHHNLITIDEDGPDPRDEATSSEYFASDKIDILRVNADYWNRFFGIITDRKAIVKREVVVHEDELYYTVSDKVINRDFFGQQDIAFQFSGNGSTENGQNSFHQSKNIAIWDHPCKKELHSGANSNNWKIRLVTNAILDDAVLNLDLITSINRHGNSSVYYFNNGFNDDSLATGLGQIGAIETGDGIHGDHTTVTIKKSIGFKDEIRFLSTIELFRCSDTTTFSNLPSVKYGPKYICHVVKRDSKKDVHLTRSYKSIVTDTIIDPMDFSTGAILETDANNIFFSYDSNPEFKSGNCISYCNFRKARIVEGRLFTYNDTTYLSATKFSTTYYALIGKCKYQAYIETDTACTVSFYLADVEKGIGMKVKDLSYTYDTNTCIITVSVPVGFSQFEIELEDPCRVSCFFPSTAETIHETFDFNQGVTATLGHKLDIVQPNGFLNITNGSHMKLCDGIYLRNRDSLILFSGCGKDTGQMSVTTCDGKSNGTPYGAISGAGGGAKASMISVMSGAALVLDDSSFTQISNNSELHVWGSLVIKAGAKLVIGDGRTCSYASIMVYPGAYVHIDDAADLEFFKIIGDTQDRHIFFISNRPIGAAAIKGIAPSIAGLIFTDTILDGTETPIDICDLYTVTPDHGIANREWGFSNVLKPKAQVRIPNDTICEGECLLIDFSASLNDPIRYLEVCRIDTMFGIAIESCFGNQRIEGMQLTQGYNESSQCYYSEASLKLFPLCNYIDSANKWYKILVKVENHCGIEDTQSVYFFVAKKPNALISLADSIACGGYSTVKAYNWSSVGAEKAMYHVHLIDTTQYQDGDENHFFYGGDWEIFNLHFGDSFEFPDFKWVGGFKYAISLTQYGWCGESNTSWDTVEVQPGAIIIASPATVYSDPLGPGALQLQGYVGDADYFTWLPTDYLNNPYVLNPIATPLDTITYILSAFKAGCEAFDTLFVKNNTLAYAGLNDTVCSGESILLGTSFDATLFLAYQYYENPTDVWNEIDSRLGIDPYYFDKLSMYFISNEGRGVLNTFFPYTAFLGSINRNQFYEKEWFINFFQLFHNERNYQDAFTLFQNEVDNDPEISNYILSNPLFASQPFQSFLDLYNSDIHTGAASQMSTTWEKYTNETYGWESLGSWDNQIKIWDSVPVSTLYKITVIDNANNKVEFDQVTIYAHQSISPAYYVQFQIDSTLYFSNQSEPIDYSAQYLWDFGDGNTSSQINPIYTFPFFDSSYFVCLTATNLCGTSIYCDTVRVDSSGLGMYSKIQKPAPTSGNTTQTSFKTDGITLIAFPNPFSSEVNIAYQISQDYTQANLKLTDYLGKELQTYPITNAKGSLALPMQDLSVGLYTYQLIIDGRLVQTGKLVKE